MWKFLIPLICLSFSISIADCVRPDCGAGIEGEYGECIIHFKNQAFTNAEVDQGLELFADNLQRVLRETELTFFNTITVRECATPEFIKANLHRINIFWVDGNFNCIVDGTLTRCLGTSLYGEITLAWHGKISATVFCHELMHWVDEICDVDIDWDHERDDWWGIVDDMDNVLKEAGL